MTNENLIVKGKLHNHGATQQAGRVTDVVCGMTVDPTTTPHKATHQGSDYFFCGAGCKTKFQASPGKYLVFGDKTPQPVIAGAIYTCPMHPEIRQEGPGSCPYVAWRLSP